LLTSRINGIFHEDYRNDFADAGGARNTGNKKTKLQHRSAGLIAYAESIGVRVLKIIDSVLAMKANFPSNSD
jgi:hypothetical protein